MPLHADYIKIRDNFIRSHGKEEGTKFFYMWLSRNKLDDTKPFKKEDNEIAYKEIPFRELF